MRNRTLLTIMLVLTCALVLGFTSTAFAEEDSSAEACKHEFNKAKVCTTCGYAKKGTAKLKAKKYSYVNQKTWIKIKTPKKGYVEFKYKSATEGADCVMLQVYSASKKKLKNMDIRTNEMGHLFFTVKKSTYYLRLLYPESAAVKYKFKAVKCPPACGIDKARKKSPLAKNKTKTVVSTPSANGYRQTFKIKLKKKQRVTIKSKVFGPAFITLWSSSGKHCDLKGRSDTACDINYERTRKSKKKLSAGTYYLIVDQDYMGKSDAKKLTGAMMQFSWS